MACVLEVTPVACVLAGDIINILNSQLVGISFVSFSRSNLVFSRLSFEQCNVPSLRVLHVSRYSVQSTSRSNFCGCFHLRVIIRFFVFPGLARPRTGYWYLEEVRNNQEGMFCF